MCVKKSLVPVILFGVAYIHAIIRQILERKDRICFLKQDKVREKSRDGLGQCHYRDAPISGEESSDSARSEGGSPYGTCFGKLSSDKFSDDHRIFDQ